MSSVLEWSLDRAHRINELVDDPTLSYLWTDASSLTSNSLNESSRLVLELIDKLKDLLNRIDRLDEGDLKSSLQKVFNDLKKNGKNSAVKNLWKMTRVILIGNEQGPPVAELICLLGRENSLYRLNLAKDIISKTK